MSTEENLMCKVSFVPEVCVVVRESHIFFLHIYGKTILFIMHIAGDLLVQIFEDGSMFHLPYINRSKIFFKWFYAKQRLALIRVYNEFLKWFYFLDSPMPREMLSRGLVYWLCYVEAEIDVFALVKLRRETREFKGDYFDATHRKFLSGLNSSEYYRQYWAKLSVVHGPLEDRHSPTQFKEDPDASPPLCPVNLKNKN